ncbi:Bug family tripartite tricarboxylate transporter substrate binding protein [Roseomonas populi]|uniref:Tripartite tricarboxylate transporter substrate binding protein n=1 Tax=Roseomonas populi TaxID=3121582 RepID=A0ABT1X8U6_9PROT|nr:tripartite tricarboxylate transporter substrate binding protein [Roseomonas pecuniae]MCR0984530.1 tripartite tricarboxylate transporter substrate binding protein [Roseomonas pecuniae]
MDRGMRRAWPALLLAGLLSCHGTPPARAADTYPDHPIQMIMPLPPGSGTDLMARVFATEMGRVLGQRVVVMNRTGASLTIGMGVVATTPADGYTLAFSPVTPIVVQTHRVRNLPYGAESFVPVCQTFDNVFHVAVPQSSRFHSLREVLEEAKARPGSLRYGHTGPASGPHLAGAELWRQAGVQLVDVPYRGEADFTTNLLSGSLDMGMSTTFLVQSQNLRSLAVIARERLPSMPEVPTVHELGLDVVSVTYGGLFLRAGTPGAVVERLEAACREVLGTPAYREVARQQAVAATYLDTRAFRARMAADDPRVAALIQALDLGE